jgi:phosphoribosylformylglycinamidine synthase subunit PurL
MLVVVAAGREREVEASFERFGLHASRIGRLTADPTLRCTSGGQAVCDLPPRALTDGAPRHVRRGTPPADLERRRALDLGLASRPATAHDLLRVLSAPNVRSRRPVWRRYDHMNGTNTLVGPGAGDAALLRVKGTSLALALALDGPGRLGALDPWLAGASAAIEAALNVACTGATPVGLTNCLNFGNPQRPEGYWQLAQAIAGLAQACRLLGVPVVSGNVSLYNETPAGPILPTPMVGAVGLIEDRTRAVPMRWADGDEIWLLGEPASDADSLAGAELPALDGVVGGRPRLDLEAAARLVSLLPRLAGDGVVAGLHDLSVGGLAAAAARVAIASGIGASLAVPTAGRDGETAALFGERGGRVLAAVPPARADALRDAASRAGVAAERMGGAGGASVRIEGLRAAVDVPIVDLRAAWETGF